MRILHTVFDYFPNVGGSEKVVQIISEGLAARGHEVIVATRYHPERPSHENLNGTQVYRFDVSGNLANGLSGDVKSYQKFVKELSCDVMMNYTAQSWSTDALLPILPELSCKKILAPVGYSELYNPKFNKYYETLAQDLQKYDHLIYHSTLYRDKRFGDWQQAEISCSIIPNGAEENTAEITTDFVERYSICEDDLVIVAVSNHYRLKGHNQIIQAFKKAKLPRAKLFIIGHRIHNSPFRGCYPLCKLSSVTEPNIQLVESAKRQEVLRFFKRADILLHGSRLETAPLVIYEAMAGGVPFVTTWVGNVMELPGGIVVHDVSEMAWVLKNLASRRDLRLQLSEQGKRYWQENGKWDRIISQYENTYQHVLNNRHSSGLLT